MKVMTYMLDMSGSIQRTKEFTMQQVGETGETVSCSKYHGSREEQEINSD